MTKQESCAWILLWDQVQRHYGDIGRKESTAEFIARMSKKFKLEIKFPQESDEEQDMTWV